MSLPVLSTPEADAQIRAINSWWVVNRPAAPSLFLEELANCFMVLEHTPEIGKRYRRHAAVSGLRRVLLRATRYQVYYVVQPQAVEILAVWHSRRGMLPRLSEP